MKSLHAFNCVLWLIGAFIAGIHAHSLSFTLYELSGASLAAVMWWLEP